MNLVKKIFINSSWIFGGRIVSSLIGLAIAIYFARYLQPELFGNFSFILVVVSLFSILAGSGIETVLEREYAKKGKILPTYFKTSIVLKLVSGVLSLIICIMISYFFYNNLIIGLVIGSAMILFSAITAIIEQIYTFQLKHKILVISDVLSKLFYLLLGLLLIYLDQGLVWLVAGWVSFYFFRLIITASFARNRLKTLILHKFNKEVSKYLIKESWPVFIIICLTMTYFRLDVIMLSIFKSITDIGLYSAAYRLSEVPIILAAALSSSLFPIFSSRRDTGKFLVWSMRFLLILSMPLVIGTILIAPKLINFIYGQSYSLATPALSVLMAATFFMFLKAPLVKYSLASGKQRSQMFIAIAGLVTNILLNLILIPKYGIVGAAVATAITEAMVFLMLLLQFRNLMNGANWISSVLRIALSTFVMALAVIGLNALNIFSLFVIIPVAILVYFALTLRFTLDKEDWAIIKTIFARD